jgi:UDP-glucose:(heptosyl)LPS alpha-1,3-glucosyltransferase
MQIALVIFRADPERGGAERYTADLAAALQRRGHSVDLIASRFGPSIDGVNFIELKSTSATRLGAYRTFLSQLDDQLARSNYDIVHAMLPVTNCDIYHPHAGLASEAMERKWTNRWNFKRREFANVERQLISGAQKPIVLCLSDYVAKLALEQYPNAKPQLVKLFNAVDLERFNPAGGSSIRKQFGIETAAVVALMIAQDFERKGLATAIQALGSTDPILLVAGRDDFRPYAALAKKLGVAERVIFAGATDAAENFYSSADFFVLPTRHDPCSLVVLESLAMGLPVISTVFNGACEIMENGRHGFVLNDPSDVGALAEAMRKMTDATFRKSAREACLALRPQLSFDAHVQRLEQIYLSRVAQKSAARAKE